MVPAAASDADGWLDIYESPQQLIRGGALPMSSVHLKKKHVLSVDVAQWLLKLPQDAYVFLKIDIEGAEHRLLKRMEELGSHRRVSRISIECHGPCAQTMRRIRSWNVTLMTENMHGGMDKRSREHAARPLNPNCTVTCERNQ